VAEARQLAEDNALLSDFSPHQLPLPFQTFDPSAGEIVPDKKDVSTQPEQRVPKTQDKNQRNKAAAEGEEIKRRRIDVVKKGK
jgi:hypothetical protein